MADETGSVMEWAVTSLGKMALGKAGEYAFTEVLALVGHPSSDKQILAKLDQISHQLDSISKAVQGLQVQIAGLQTQLNIDKLEIEQHISTEAAKEPFGALEQLFGTPFSRDNSLMALAKGQGQTNVQAFRQRVETDVQPAIDKLHNALVTTFASDKSLLQQWTDLLILKLQITASERDNFAGVRLQQQLKSSWQLLLSYFMQALTAQLKGVAMKAAVYEMDSKGNGHSRAMREFRSTLEDELDLFTWCLERLFFSQMPLNSRRGDLWSLAMEGLLSADLLNFTFAEMYRNSPSLFQRPVAFGRILCLPSTPVDFGGHRGHIRFGGQEILSYGSMSQRPCGLSTVVWRPSDTPFGQIASTANSSVTLLRTKFPGGSDQKPPGWIGLRKWDYVTNEAFPDCAFLAGKFSPSKWMLTAGEGFDLDDPSPQMNVSFYVDFSRVHSVPIVAGEAWTRKPEELSGSGSHLQLSSVQESRGPHILADSNPPPYSKSFTAIISSPAFGASATMDQTTQAALFVCESDEKLLVAIDLQLSTSAYADYQPQEGMRFNTNLLLTIVGDDGSSVLAYDSDTYGYRTWEYTSPYAFNRAFPCSFHTKITARRGVHYSLSIRFVTNMSADHSKSTTYQETIAARVAAQILRDPSAILDS
jgi:hypothetical protein